MGSFNTTCFASQQTIAPEDECFIFPISQKTTYKPVDLVVPWGKERKEISKYGFSNSNCYSTGFWGYEAPMLKGTYDDYGRFKLERRNENFKMLVYFLNILERKVCDVKQGENSYHDLPLDYKSLYSSDKKYTAEQLEEIFNKVWDVSSESRLFVVNYSGEPVNLSFAVMHKCVGEYLIDKLNNKKDWHGNSLEQKEYFHKYMNEKWKEMKEIFSEKLNNPDKRKETFAFYAINVVGLDGFRIGESEGSSIRSRYPHSNSLVETIIKHIDENFPLESFDKKFTDEMFGNFKTQIDHRYINDGLDSLNIKLSPIVYATQDYDNDLGNKYLEMVKFANEKVNHIVKQKYGEDDEENVTSSPKI